MYLSKERGSVKPPTVTFFDFEATTKEPATAEILTGYFKTVDAETRLLVDELHIKMKPDKWVFESYEFHGLSQELCATFPPKKVIMREIFRYLKKHIDSLFICHANFQVFGIKGYYDWQLIKKECLYLDVLHHFNSMFKNIDVYSTHTMARDRKLPVTNCKLNVLAEFIGFDFKHHDCVQDVLATEALFWWMIEGKTLFDYMEE